MHRLSAPLIVTLVLAAPLAFGQARPPAKDQSLGRKDTKALDTSLAGDITRKADAVSAAPALEYDTFRLGVELQVADKRHEQIESLKKIMAYSNDPKEAPTLLFQLGELYWEESKYFFFEANRQDDAFIKAMNANDAAGQKRAKAEKDRLLGEQKKFVALALEQYKEIVQRHRDFEKSDQVLYFLGQLLMESGEEQAALKSFQRLISQHPKSKFLPEAYVAFGEYYFNNSKGRQDWLQKALAAYERAAAYPENQGYGYAIYKQGWCYFNLGDYAKAKDRFKTVVLFGQLGGAASVEKDGDKRKSSLVREARSDFVRAYSRDGDVMAAKREFGALAGSDDDARFEMTKRLANFYYSDGKDREAAITFHALIQERPLSPEAPGFQGKIVDCVLRAGDKKRTVVQTRRLVELLVQIESSGVIKTDKDKKEMAEARELAERTLSNLAVNWHQEGRKTRDDETFGYAAEIYKDYLSLFSDSPKAYDLRFFWAELLNDNLNKYDRAAIEYDAVALQDIDKAEGRKKDADGKAMKPGKYFEPATYNAILAWDQVVTAQREAGKLKVERSKDGKPAEIKPPMSDLIAASERYVKYIEKGEKRVEVLYRIARTYYDYDHLDEAIRRFNEITDNYPDYKFENGDLAGELAANLVLDSYNLREDYENVQASAIRFYGNPKLARGKFKKDLEAVIEQSSFKLVNQMEARKEWARAGQAYLDFVEKFPESSIAEQALYNASLDFFKAKMLDRAVEVRKNLIRNYPSSKYVPDAVYDNAEALATVGDFEAAVGYYDLYVRGYERAGQKQPAKRTARKGRKAAPVAAASGDQKWDEEKAQNALINAGVMREGLGQFAQARKAREHYLELWPKAKDAEAVFLSIGELYEAQGLHSRALKHYEVYQKDYGRSPQALLTGEARIHRLFSQALNRPRDASRILNRVVEYNKTLGRTARSRLTGEALDMIGMASMHENEAEVWRPYTGIRLRWGRGSALVSAFRNAMDEKIRSRKIVERAYTKTVALGAPGPAICALTRIGDAAMQLYDGLVDAPPPPGLEEAVQFEVKAQLAQEALPVAEQAADAYALALTKSREIEVNNDCSKQALEKLRELRPAQYPTMVEVVAPMGGGKLDGALVRSAMLAEIQPLPDAPVAPVGKTPAEAPNKGADANRGAVAPAAGKQPASGGTAGGSSDPFSDEPEDVL